MENLVLPVVLVGGWFVVGAILAADRPLAAPIAAGAIAGSVAVNIFFQLTAVRWPTIVVDPVSPLLIGAEIVLNGFPAGGLLQPLAWAGTALSALAVIYLAVIAVRTTPEPSIGSR